MKLLIAKRLVVPLGYRDFRLLWIGQAISALGNPFQVVAVAWLVLQLKGSALDLANIMLALTIPQAVVTLAGGVLIDRLDARTVMLWSDTVRTITSGTIALLAFTESLPLWLLCIILLFHSAANGLFSPAAMSIPPHLVLKENLDSANSLMQLISQLGTFLGAVPAGLLIASYGPAIAFALNSLSFAVAVLATLLMTPLRHAIRDQKSSVFDDARQGFAYLRSFPWLITLLLVDTFAAVAAIGPTAIGLPLLARNTLHVGAQGYSLVVWSFGVGTIIGMVLPGMFSPRHHRGRFFCLIQIIEAPLLAAIAFTSLPIAMFCLASVGLLNGFLVILFLSLLQANIAKEMTGRIMSLFMLASVGFVPFSQYASGIIANAAGIQILFISAGVLTMLGAVLGFLAPSLRRLD
jgi:MFS family permease